MSKPISPEEISWNLESAEGEQLDQIGLLIGERRNLRGDEDKRLLEELISIHHAAYCATIGENVSEESYFVLNALGNLIEELEKGEFSK